MLSDRSNSQQGTFKVHISGNSTVNFRRYDPINTAPVFPAGDLFLTPKEEKRTTPSFPAIRSPGKQQVTLLFCSWTNRRQIGFGHKRRKGQSSGLGGDGHGWASAHHLPPRWKGQAEDGRGHGVPRREESRISLCCTSILIRLGTGGNYSSLRKSESRDIKCIFARSLSESIYFISAYQQKAKLILFNLSQVKSRGILFLPSLAYC